MALESIYQRWTSLGWDVKEMNGDDIDDIVKSFSNINFENHCPHLLISHTTKGKGVSYMENVVKWHHGVPTEEEFNLAIQEISERIATLEK